ncbi:hypothetical protein UT300013_17480 [Paraclostridium sordellii]|uniref:hypothetical protein n=1 Tax=Paraclostridium sordellii TaxID=1505 RepID=UPI000E4A28CE|nr:hypothetical protein [Paeniclostridium sordellii]RGX08396.1 hypothetical protein DWV40_08645 [Paeniclostridium sordellii]
MSCKNNIWKGYKCIENQKWDNVCYYKCKDNGCGPKKCKEEIKDAKDLIDDAKDTNNMLGKDLKDALENQNAAKEGIKGLEDNLLNLACDLSDIKKALSNAVKNVDNMIKDLNQILPDQQNAIEDIKDAKDKQKEVKGILDKLNKALDDVVDCLSERGSNPILIPWDEDCDKHPCKNDCDC